LEKERLRLGVKIHPDSVCIRKDDRWRYDRRSKGSARSARSSAATAGCSWSVRTRATSSGRV